MIIAIVVFVIGAALMLYIKNYFAQVNLNIIFSEAVFYFVFFLSFCAGYIRC